MVFSTTSILNRAKTPESKCTVYAQGSVIQKLKSTCQDLLNSPDYDEDMLRRALEDQHRQVMARNRASETVPLASPSLPAHS
jgi:hypothetical protein